MPVVLKNPPLLPFLLAAASLVVLGGLGTWQAQKYALKSEGRSGICAQETLKIQNSGFNDFSANAQAACPNKVKLEGYLLNKPIIPLGPRIHDEERGYYLYVPLKAKNDDTIILANLGWSDKQDITWTAQYDPAQPIIITGSLAPPKEKGAFTLDNLPEKNEWFSIQPQEISAVFELKSLSGYTFHASAIEPEAMQNFIPASLSKLYLTPETHLQYAAFWYCMALALLVIFTLRFAIVQTTPDKH